MTLSHDGLLGDFDFGTSIGAEVEAKHTEVRGELEG
jgi:hypothetical protein